MGKFRLDRQQLKQLFALGLPIVGSNMAMMIIGITDTVMMGWYSIPDLAALILGTTFFFNFIIFGSGFAFATVPLVASASAKSDTTTIRRVTRMALWLSIGFGALITPVFLYVDRILIFLGQDPEISVLALNYLAISGFALVPMLWATVFKSYLSGMELTKIALWITLVAAVSNGVLNYIFIFGKFGMPEMGVRGAAISSLLSHLFQALAFTVYALRKFPEHQILVRFYKPDWGALRQVAKMGLPIGTSTFAEVGLFSAASFLMGWVGVIELAAHGIALQVASLTFMAHLGLASAATILAGKAYGREDLAELRSGSIAAAVMILLWSVITSTIFVVFGAPIVSLFLDINEPARDQIISYGVVLLIVAALFQFVDGIQVLAISLLRGIHDTAVPMYITIVSYWAIGLPVAYILGFVVNWQGVGVWLGLTSALACAAVAMTWRYRSLLAKLDGKFAPQKNDAAESAVG